MKSNQNDYTDFTKEQFAADEYFQQWVLRADGELTQFWESYLLLHPMQKTTLLRARRLVKELAAIGYDSEPLSVEEKATTKHNIFHSLQLPLTSGRTTFLSSPKKSWISRAVAAVLLVIATPLYFLLKPEKKSGSYENNSYAIQTVRTGPKEMKRIVLADSTVVLLNAGSSLRFNNNFNNGSAREVELDGNAFFNVKKDARQLPFIVHTRSLAITVLGTELNVNARTAEAEVELTRGKVKVEQKGNAEAATYLQPGDKLKLDTARQAFIKTRMDAQLYSAWTDGKWNFRQTTLEQITGLIREYYGVDVVFKNENSRYSRIDAVIPVASLQDLVPVIEHTLQVKMEIVNNQLIIE